MLEEIYSTDELIDNLRIIYKGKTKDEKFKLIRITNEFGEMVMMPVSDKSMYDMFVIINDNVYHNFTEEINKDPIKKQQYLEMKFHDGFIDDMVTEAMKKPVKRIDRLRNIFRDGILFNRELMKEFEIHKAKTLMENTIREESGLLANYYISNYITIYNDISLDYEKILIDSLNAYTKIVTRKTDHSYPIIKDYGTAHDYFFKIYNNCPMKVQNKDTRLGRLYYREMLNEDMLDFVKETCNRMILRSVLMGVLLILCSASLLFITKHVLIYWLIGYITVLMTLNTLYKINEKYFIIRRYHDNISYENRTLKGLAEAEQDTIKKWYGLN